MDGKFKLVLVWSIPKSGCLKSGDLRQNYRVFILQLRPPNWAFCSSGD